MKARTVFLTILFTAAWVSAPFMNPMALSETAPLLVDNFEGDEIRNLLGGRSNVYVKAPSRAMVSLSSGYAGDETQSLLLRYDKANEGGPFGRGGWCGYYTLLVDERAAVGRFYEPGVGERVGEGRRAEFERSDRGVAEGSGEANFEKREKSELVSEKEVTISRTLFKVTGQSSKDRYRYRRSGDGGPRVRGGWAGHYALGGVRKVKIEKGTRADASKSEETAVEESRHADMEEMDRAEFVQTYFGKGGSEEEVYFDGTGFQAITFWVRGENGEENFVVGLADRHWQRIGDTLKSEDIGNYLPAGRITTEWQKATISLDVFFLDYSKLYAVVIAFEADCYVGGKGAGTIYLDDLEFI